MYEKKISGLAAAFQDNKILYFRLTGKHIYHVCTCYVLGLALNLKHKIYSTPCFIYFSWHSKNPNCQCLNQTVQSENFSIKWFWFQSKFVVTLYYNQSTVCNQMLLLWTLWAFCKKKMLSEYLKGWRRRYFSISISIVYSLLLGVSFKAHFYVWLQLSMAIITFLIIKNAPMLIFNHTNIPTVNMQCLLICITFSFKLFRGTAHAFWHCWVRFGFVFVVCLHFVFKIHRLKNDQVLLYLSLEIFEISQDIGRSRTLLSNRLTPTASRPTSQPSLVVHIISTIIFVNHHK